MTTNTFLPDWDYSQPWYHGSPLELDVLLLDSTITQNAALARAFSHKPTLLSFEDEVTPPRIRHNGTRLGLLYRIDEPITSADVHPHPRTSMAPGLEWLTTHPLRLTLIADVELDPNEFLNEDDIQGFLSRD